MHFSLFVSVSLIFALAMIASPSTAHAYSGPGTGTIENPYTINNCLQLTEISDDLNANYSIANNIDCADTVNWNGGKGFDPIGDDSNPFTGSLNGNNYTVDGLYMNWADDEPGQSETDRNYVGLFGATTDATIQNINLANLKSKGYEYVGGLVGYALSSTISNVTVNTEVADSSCDPGNCVWARWGAFGGGIVGLADASSLSEVSTGGPVKGSGIVIGGIAGAAWNGSIIDNANSSSNIDGGDSIGGLVGALDNSTVTDSNASGDVNCVYDDGFKQGNNAGGLVGVVDNGGSITNSHASGSVIGYQSIGGLVGRIWGESSVAESYATGNVEGNQYLGGIVGLMSGGNFNSVYATGSVSGQNYNVGGFAGYMDGGEISDAYSRGNVTSDQSYAGGFVGTIYGGTIRRAYSTGIVTIPESGAERAGSFSSEAYEDGTDIAITDSFASGGVNAPAGEGGFIANLNTTGMEFANNYFDIIRTAQLDCRAVPGAVEGCTGVNVNDSQPGYFLGNSSSQVFNTWDFDLVWKTVEDDYPCLSWQESCSVSIAALPQIECLQPTVSKTSIQASCSTNPKLQGQTNWELRYRKKGANEWTGLANQTGDTFNVTVDDVTQATDYEIGFRYINALGTSEWGKVLAKTNSDLNGDGVLDLQQPNISSFISPITGKYVAVDVGEGCTITLADLARESNLDAQDAAYEYANGLFDFAGDCGSNGFTTTVKLYYYDVTKENLVVRKYNPNTKNYFSLTGSYGATIEQTTIDGKTVTIASYQIKDGGDLDMDQATNGKISDPAGIAKPAVKAPNTGIDRHWLLTIKSE